MKFSHLSLNSIVVTRIFENKKYYSQIQLYSIVAAGGGKVLDAGKLIQILLHIPVITVPLSASTCAGWTSLSNIYSNKGQFLKDVKLRSCPKIFIFDHGFINSAPRRTLASGIADALAKWYESSLTCSNLNDGLTQQAVQISRVLRDQLLINGESAYENQSEENLSWVNSIEGCGITAGLLAVLVEKSAELLLPMLFTMLLHS